MHRVTIYFKDIFMLDAMKSTKPGSLLKTTLNEFFQTRDFFSAQNNVADYLKI